MAKTRAKVHTGKAKAGAVGGITNTPEQTAVRPQSPEEATAALAYECWIQRGCPMERPTKIGFEP